MSKIIVKDTRLWLSVLTGMFLVASLVTVKDAKSTNVTDPSEATVFAGTYITLGANSVVRGDVQSGTAVTLGAGAEVDGIVQYATGMTYGAGATTSGDAETVAYGYQGVFDAQSALDAIPHTVVLLPGNIAADVTFSGGVYDVAGLLTVAAGTTITLDAANKDSAFIFNIRDYLTFGAGVNIKVINGNKNTRVIWNSTSGYITLGANANIIGTIFAYSYVSTGANSTVGGVGPLCGAVYATTSYVSLGAGAKIGDASCPSVPPTP